MAHFMATGRTNKKRTNEAYFRKAHKLITMAIGDGVYSQGMLPSLREKINAINAHDMNAIGSKNKLLQYIDQLSVGQSTVSP